MAGTELLTVSNYVVSNPTITDDLAAGGPSFAMRWQHVYTDGLNSGQVGYVYANERSLATSGTEDLDLAGSLYSDVAELIAGAKLRYIRIINDGPGTLNFTRPNANGVVLFLAANDGIALEEGDTFEFASKTGKTITAATGDLLTFTEAGVGPTTYRIIMGIRGS